MKKEDKSNIYDAKRFQKKVTHFFFFQKLKCSSRNYCNRTGRQNKSYFRIVKSKYNGIHTKNVITYHSPLGEFEASELDDIVRHFNKTK